MLVVDPIHEQHLLVEFSLARGDHLVQMILLAQLLEFGVVVGVEFEAFAIFALDVGERVERSQRRMAITEGEGVALFEGLGTGGISAGNGREKTNQNDHCAERSGKSKALHKVLHGAEVLQDSVSAVRERC